MGLRCARNIERWLWERHLSAGEIGRCLRPWKPHFRGKVTDRIFDNSTSSIPPQVLTGNPPYGPRHIFRLSSSEDSPKRPSWTPIPDHPIWDLVERCWEQDPGKRPQVTETLDALTSPGMTFPEVWPPPKPGSVPDLGKEAWAC